MLIDLRRMFQTESEILPLACDVDFSDVTEQGVPVFQTPVRLEGTVENHLGIVELSASAEFTYCAPCDRCAEVTERKMSVPIRHTLVTELNESDQGAYLVVESMRLDVDELVRTDVLLALPVKYLCKEDCEGLCPMCGANLNTGACSCKKAVDPRMEALLGLLDDSDET